MKDQTHERCREIVEFYLKIKGRQIFAKNYTEYGRAFVIENKLEKRFKGHSYDIWTDKEIIEIDDYQKHSKKNQMINDGVAGSYAIKYLKQWQFCRLQKEEIVDSKGHLQPTAARYLKDNLF
jgi:hypothetical protein